MSTSRNAGTLAGVPSSTEPHAADALPARLVFLLASAAGFAVAALYYSQPMLGVLGPSMGASASTVGWVPTLTQLGYALGILFLAPLGDRFDRRTVILTKAVALVLALLLAGIAPTIGVLLAASFAIGISATMAQDVVPAAASLAPAAHRGKVVGTVMTGLLMGILLSRVVSGFVAQNLSWRTMFIAAAVSVAMVGIAAWRGLPRFKATTHLSYGALIASLGTLVREHASLRRATLAQALLSVAFSAFWSTLAVMLHGAPFHLGSAAAGSFGLAGAAGALAAPLAGRLADSRGPEWVTRLGATLVIISFAAMALAPAMTPPMQMAVLVVATVGFDLGVQATLIAHQTIVYGIDPAARGRLNAVLFVGMFLGMALGSALGSIVLARWGWSAVMLLSAVMASAALMTRLWPAAKRVRHHA